MRSIITYKDTLVSKNKLKKITLLRFLLLRSDLGKVGVSTKDNQKNIFLDSPFHFKIAKTHLNIPSLTFYIESRCNPKTLSYVGLVVSVSKLHDFKYKV